MTQSAVAASILVGNVAQARPRHVHGCIGCQSLARARTAAPGAVLKHQTGPKRAAAKIVFYFTGQIAVTPLLQALPPSPDLVSIFQAHPKNRVDQIVFLIEKVLWYSITKRKTGSPLLRLLKTVFLENRVGKRSIPLSLYSLYNTHPALLYTRGSGVLPSSGGVLGRAEIYF